MREISLEEQKKIMLDILLDFDKVCRKNDIGYSLAWGTLLGAVRHRGFIPWDDDIDVLVTRENYNKIRNKMNGELSENHRFICVENEKRFSAPLAKVIDKNTVLKQVGHNSDKIDLGVYVDVFVLDYIPTETRKREKIFRKSVLLQKIWSFSGNNYDSSRLLYLLRSLANKLPIARNTALYANKWAENLEEDSSLMASILFGEPDRSKEVMEYSDINDLAEYEFEGHLFLGVKDYDKYLKQWYGDYMKLPPEDQRVSNHSTIVFKK